MKTKRILALALTAIITFTGNGNLYAAELPETENVAEANGEILEEKIEGDYSYTVSNGCATITAYNGTEESVVTPETLGGYLVTEIGARAFSTKTFKEITVSEGVARIGNSAFWGCENVRRIDLPSTVNVIGYNALNNTAELSTICVNEKNRVFFDKDGVLFKRHATFGTLLDLYPMAKKDVSYVVPDFVERIAGDSFYGIKYLEKLYVPSTVKTITVHAFLAMEKPLDVYLRHDKVPDVNNNAFKAAKGGINLIVKNQEIAEEITKKNIFYECENSSIVILGDEGYPAIPTTSLTWEGSQTDMSHTLSPGEKCQLTYVQEPLNSTDNITWSSSDEKVARVDAIIGLVEASGGVNYPVQTGTCTITGTDESGHSISVDMTVYKPIESVELSEGDETVVLLDKSNPYVFAGLAVKPFDANNISQVKWKSSNEEVASVLGNGGDIYYPTGNEKDNYYENAVKVTLYTPGTTTITATLDDNGTIWTKFFVLTVTKDISDCTIAAVADQTYTGSDITPAVSVKDGSRILVNGIDYEVNYSDNRAVGMASASIIGKGLYSGTATVYFNIIQTEKNNNGSETGSNSAGNNDGDVQKDDTNPTWKSQSITGVGSSYEKAYGDKAFTLKAKAKGMVTYASDNGRVASVDRKTGKVSIKGTGTCTITVTAAETGSYKEAVKKIIFNVSPKKETVTSVKPFKKNQITVKWKKDTKATGYQIQYSTSKKFTKKTTGMKTVAKSKTASGTVKKLKSGKTYYVRVRAYKTVKESGKSKSLYGSWSKAKQVKVK